MTELDDVWTGMLRDAVDAANRTGRHDVADYLRLKATNDSIRRAGVGWLVDTLTEFAAKGQLPGKDLRIERVEPHRFVHGNSTMVGILLSISQGVRCLTLEAGWARTPSDGIMRQGALAHAQLKHFGMPRASSELRLVFSDPLPEWLDQTGAPVDEAFLQRQIGVLLSL